MGVSFYAKARPVHSVRAFCFVLRIGWPADKCVSLDALPQHLFQAPSGRSLMLKEINGVLEFVMI
ncbi:hypothetical protein, partial [Robbsia andropogonis]|uniref:hypothetical protein n=1 Tax=Robbsia andropogonis TaxID=28092 RepID=UPI00209EFB53